MSSWPNSVIIGQDARAVNVFSTPYVDFYISLHID